MKKFNRILPYLIIFSVLSILFFSCNQTSDGSSSGGGGSKDKKIQEPSISISQSGSTINSGDVNYNIGITQNGAPINITFSIENNGSSVLNLTGTPVVDLSGDAVYSIDLSSTLDSIETDNSTDFIITFNPASSGVFTAEINIENNDNDFSFSIEGTAFEASPEIILKDNSTPITNESIYDIGSTSPGITIEKTFTIENVGNFELDLTGTPIIDCTGDAEFTLDLTSTSSQVSINDSTTFILSFTPNSSGTYSTVIDIPNTDPDESPFNFTINAECLEPEIHIVRTDSNEDIADGAVNVTLDNGIKAGTYDYTFTIYNEGNEVLELGGTPIVNISGDNYSIISQPSSSQIEAGSSLSFTIRFNAVKGTGWNYADITIENNDNDENPYNFNVRIRVKN